MFQRKSGTLGRRSVRAWALSSTIVLIWLGGELLSAGVDRAGAAQPESDRLQTQLQAGEFSLALQLARHADESMRDERLAQIASAQRRAGAWQASLTTLAEIADDRVRADVLRSPSGAAGGGAQADFESLIDLIKGTIAPESWDDIGGPGAIDEFAGGVYVDPGGVLRKSIKHDSKLRLTSLRNDLRDATTVQTSPAGPRRSSPLRKISLTRLEKHVQLLLSAGRQPTDAMRVLAGLQRIRYVFVYPETGDLVIAGPAGDWYTDTTGRSVSVETARPVVLLDDLVVVLRGAAGDDNGVFGCSIDPTTEGLARTKRFLDESGKQPLKVGQRQSWQERLRSQLGRQNIRVFGIDPRSRAARVLVEADYHMKLIGMGLAESVAGVPCYLELVKVPPGESPPPLGVLRWWFALNYQAILANADDTAFELRGPACKVLSENELLSEQGQRVATGASEELNQEFAHYFTTHFDALASKYPIYAQLQNVFDAAVVAALVDAKDLDTRVGWHRRCFGPEGSFATARGPVPTQVDSVINHRVINRVHIIAGVSGGVSVDPWPLVDPAAMETARYGELQSARGTAPNVEPLGPWWWD